MREILSKIFRKWQLILYITFVAGSCAFFVSTLIPPKYRSDITILFIQKEANTASASRSVEYLSEIFSQVIFTELFLDDILDSSLEIEKKFSDDPGERKKQWEKEVQVEKISGAGILKISVFDESMIESRKIARAIARNFSENGQKYHGRKEVIEPKLIDGPITSSLPVSPNILLNTVLGLIIGFVGSIIVAISYGSFDLRVVKKKSVIGGLVKSQLKRQLEKRKEKGELAYEFEEDSLFTAEQAVSEQKSVSKPQEKSRKILPTSTARSDTKIPSKISTDVPDLEGSMINKDEFERNIALKKEDQKEEALFVKDKRVFEKAQSRGKGVISRLYGRSIFADKKFRDIKAVRTTHHREFGEPILPVAESVRKITMPEKREKKESFDDKKKQKRAVAPKNLPIFMADVDQKITPKAKETPPIKYIEEPSDVSTEKEQYIPSNEVDKIIRENIAANDFQIQPERNDIEREPTEDEVKEKLNKLLKGEL
ncbi:MAG: Wzz/FepE/Etk N-terminal domain-containing protein [Patescibacteria group bacterium]|nr:Wzz/FepE/Etk N-terminal domain-containing protein [Patescibacteria group bacterium]